MNKLLPLLAFSILLLVPVGAQNAFASSSMIFVIDFISGGPSQLSVIDPDTAIVTPLPNLIGFDRCSAMDFHPVTGELFAVCENDQGDFVLITIDKTTGIGTEQKVLDESNIPGGDFINGVPDMSFRNSDNKLFLSINLFFSDLNLGTLDLTSGVVSILGIIGVNYGGNGIAFSNGDTLYHTGDEFNGLPGFDNSMSDLHTLDQSSGAASQVVEIVFPLAVPELVNGANPNGMDFDPANGILWSSVKGDDNPPWFLVTINTANGEITNKGIVTTDGSTEVEGLDALAIMPAQVVGGEFLPIDSTALMLAGLQSSAIWMLPVLAGAAGVGAFYIKTRMNKDN